MLTVTNFMAKNMGWNENYNKSENRAVKKFDFRKRNHYCKFDEIMEQKCNLVDITVSLHMFFLLN
jgi:hypothetical protein